MTAPIEDPGLPLQRFHCWAKERAGHVFLTQPLPDGGIRDYTWAEAADQVHRIAAHLRSRAWEPGSRIAIFAKNSAEWVLADLAIWMAGHVSVPIYAAITTASARQILEHSESKACFVGLVDDAEAAAASLPTGTERIELPRSPRIAGARWDDLVRDTAPIAGEPVRAADDLATLIYTSGTTGIPKGVMHSFRTLALAARLVVRFAGGGPDDRLFSYLPLAHAAERLIIQMPAIHSGCRIFFNHSQETFLADLRRARPTGFLSVPRLWTKFQQGVLKEIPEEKLARLLRVPIVGWLVRRRILGKLGLDGVRLAVSGAAPLPPSILEWYRNLGLELLEGYAMTENFGISHTSRPGQVRIGSVGQPWEGVECKLSAGGEILVRGPCTMLGYFKDPEATRDVLGEDGFLRTGDVGRIDAEGFLRITGRVKEQFKTSKGKYVAPAPIENKLGAHPRIEASCVTGLGYPQPFAIVMLANGEWERARSPGVRRDVTEAFSAVLSSVNGELDPHERLDFIAVVPEQWTVENDLVTPTLKVKRASIERRYKGAFDDWAAQRAPVVWHEAGTAG